MKRIVGAAILVPGSNVIAFLCMEMKSFFVFFNCILFLMLFNVFNDCTAVIFVICFIKSYFKGINIFRITLCMRKKNAAGGQGLRKGYFKNVN